MEFQRFNEDVEKLFDEANEPNIYSIDFVCQKSAQNIEVKSLTTKDSVKMMLNLTNAILYLKSVLLDPCQIQADWVVADQEGIWGLKHAICYRTSQPSEAPNTYNPAEYEDHEDEEKQLMWNLGKIWLRFYAKLNTQLINLDQTEIDKIVDSSVSDLQICNVIKKLLTKNNQKRISFEQFIEEEVFNVEETSQKFYSSILSHFTNISKFAYMNSRLSNEVKEIKTPYQEAILRRDMREVLHVVAFLDKIKDVILGMYDDTLGRKFALFILMAYQYCLMKQLDQKKVENEIEDHSNEERRFYSEYAKQMLTLKHQVDKRMRITAFDSLNNSQRAHLVPTERMSLEQIHRVWKEIIGTYYNESLAQIPSGRLDLKKQKIAVQFITARICSKLFKVERAKVFSQFMKEQNSQLNQIQIFDISAFFLKLQSCEDAEKLKLLRRRIRLTYFE